MTFNTLVISTLARKGNDDLMYFMLNFVPRPCVLLLALAFASCQSKKLVSVDFEDGSYRGEVNEDGIKHGQGSYFWKDGSSYNGDFLLDKRHGNGLFEWANGETYKGDYLQDERTGDGVYTWPDGSTYEGDFLRGKRQGKGIFTSSDGVRYEGNWFDDRQNGNGKLIFPDGRIMEGIWKKGELTTVPVKVPPSASKPSINLPVELNVESKDPTSENIQPGKPGEVEISKAMDSSSISVDAASDSSAEVESFLTDEFVETVAIASTIEKPSIPYEETNDAPAPVPSPKSVVSEENVWTGTLRQAEMEFETDLIDGVDTVSDRNTLEPYTGKMRILNESGELKGEVNLLNGKLHGEEIFFDESGSVVDRNVWANGKIVE